MPMRGSLSAVRVLCIVDLRCGWLNAVASGPDKPICQLVMCLWLFLLDTVESTSPSLCSITKILISILLPLPSPSVVDEYYWRIFQYLFTRKYMTQIYRNHMAEDGGLMTDELSSDEPFKAAIYLLPKSYSLGVDISH